MHRILNALLTIVVIFLSSLSVGYAGGGGIPKTTAQMKTHSTFTSAGWDFASVWAVCDGTNYPRLI